MSRTTKTSPLAILSASLVALFAFEGCAADTGEDLAGDEPSAATDSAMKAECPGFTDADVFSRGPGGSCPFRFTANGRSYCATNARFCSLSGKELVSYGEDDEDCTFSAVVGVLRCYYKVDGFGQFPRPSLVKKQRIGGRH